MKKLILFLTSLLLLFITAGQIPQNYYATAEGKKQIALREALSEIISAGYVQRTYGDLWTDFYTTDARHDGYVWDMYCDCPFVFGTDQDNGSGGTQECQKYNREHSVPKSYFGGEKYPMYTDLFHLYPTDKYVNNERADYPFGETNDITSIYGNGSKKGRGTQELGYTGVVFEPIDEYKGDFARTYFYMLTRYMDINFTQNNLGKVTFTYNSSISDFTEYGVNLLLKWHRTDPVSEKEIHRNNAVYGIQKNRNPYIDYPDLVEHIWGNLQDFAWNTGVGITPNAKDSASITITKYECGIYIEGAAPNAKIEIINFHGQNVFAATLTRNFIPLNHLRHGTYIVMIDGFVQKFVW